MARKLSAYPVSGLESGPDGLRWSAPPSGRPMVFVAADGGPANTVSGPMRLVTLTFCRDQAVPAQDLALCVGKVMIKGAVSAASPDLWYWQDQFWMKALTTGGVEYYAKKQSLLVLVEADPAPLASIDLTSVL